MGMTRNEVAEAFTEAFVRHLPDQSAQAEQIKAIVRSLADVVGRVDTLETKKALLCQILHTRITTGVYGDNTQEPLRTVAEDLGNCFFIDNLEAYTQEELSDILDELLAANNG